MRRVRRLPPWFAVFLFAIALPFRAASADFFVCQAIGSYFSNGLSLSVSGIGIDDARVLAEAYARSNCMANQTSGVIIGNIGGVGGLGAPCVVSSCIPFPNEVPGIVEHPEDVVVERGQSFSIFCRAIGGDLTYSWFINGASTPSIFGQTIGAAQASDSLDGLRVRCRAANALGSALSNEATIRVVGQLQVPIIITQPAAVSVTEGEYFQMSVQAFGGNLTYQTQVRGRNDPDFVDLPNLTTNSVEVAEAPLTLDGASVRWRVFNTVGQVISDAAEIRVRPFATPTPTATATRTPLPPTATPTRTPTATSTATHNPTVTATATPSLSPTAIPVPTDTVSLTPTPSVQPTSNPGVLTRASVPRIRIARGNICVIMRGGEKEHFEVMVSKRKDEGSVVRRVITRKPVVFIKKLRRGRYFVQYRTLRRDTTPVTMWSQFVKVVLKK